MIAILVWSISLPLFSLPAKAETLPVSITASVARALPETTQRIARALENTGYEIEMTVFPNKRSITLLRRGEIALEFFRTPTVTASFPELIKLEPVLDLINFNMVTSIQSPGNCQASEEEYRSLSIAGVLGIGLHQSYFYPKFKNATSVNDAPTALKFVALRRADVTFLPGVVMDMFPPEVTQDLIVCPANYQPFEFYAHLHKDYAWAREKLEAALRAEFALTRDITIAE